MINKSYKIFKTCLPFLLMVTFLLLRMSGHAFCEDLLATSYDDVHGTFGKGSNFQKYLILGEVCVAVFSYIVSRKIGVFLGVILIMFFVHAFIV